MFTKKKLKDNFFSQNLELLLKQHKLDIKDLALETDVPATTIARLKRSNSNPTIASIEPIANFFRVDMSTLLYEDMSSHLYQAKKAMGEMVYIPLITLDEAKNWPNDGYSKITGFVGAAGVTNTKSYGIRITTESMAPAFQNNSIVIIDPDLDPREGDYVLCLLNNDPIAVFRQIFMDGSHLYFKPINPGFGEMQCFDTVKILGVIIKSIEDFR